MRRFLHLGALAATVALFVSPPAAAQDEVKGLLQGMRIPALYVNPAEMPRWSYSYGVIVNQWTRPMKLARIYSSATGDSLKAHLLSALKKLDATLENLKARNSEILEIDVHFVGSSFDDTIGLSDILDQYFYNRKSHSSGAKGVLDFPVRSMLGMKKLKSEGAMVALAVTILEPGSATVDAVIRPGVRMLTGGAKSILIGGVTAQQQNFLIKGYRNPRVQIKAALQNFDTVLKQAGATPRNVDSMTVFYVAENGEVEKIIKEAASSYFGDPLPNFELQPVRMACMEGVTMSIKAQATIP